MVTEGVLRKGATIVVKRGKRVVYDGPISSLRRVKEIVNEVSCPFSLLCMISLNAFHVHQWQPHWQSIATDDAYVCKPWLCHRCSTRRNALMHSACQCQPSRLLSQVSTGLECGVGCDGFSDWKEGDAIEAFEVREKRRTLEEASIMASLDDA